MVNLRLASLPNEVLFQVFSNFDDIKDFFLAASVCKKFQNIIKSMILVTGDAPTQSTFKTISSEYLQLDHFEKHAHYKQIIKKYSHIVFECSLLEKVTIQRYTSIISKAKRSKWVKVTEVFLTKPAAHYSFGLDNFDDLAFSSDNYLYDTTRTIYLNGSDEALLIQQGEDDQGEPIYDSMTIVSHYYDFKTAKILPLLSVAIDPSRHLRIRGPLIEKIVGVINYDQLAGPCLARDSNEFYRNCDLPNLKHLEGFNLKRGFDFKVFEKFTKLEIVSFTFTSSDEDPPLHQTILPNLKKLELSGNSIALMNINLPKLEVIKIRSFGTMDSKGVSDLTVDNITTPNLKIFNLQILGKTQKSLGQVLQGFNALDSLTNLEISGNIKMADFQSRFVFPNLVKCILRGNVDWNNEFFNNVLFHRTDKVAKYIKQNLVNGVTPLLEELVLEDLYDLQYAALKQNTYLQLKYFKVSLDLKDPYLREGYTLKKENFPKLETFELTLNKYLDFRREDIASILKHFINIKIADIKLSKLIVLKPLLEMECIEWSPEYEPHEIVLL